MAFIVDSTAVGSPRIGYKNLFTTTGVTVTVSTEASGYSKENAYDWFGYDWWKPTATGDSWLRASFGTAQLANYMAIWGHDLADHSSSIKPQYSTDSGATWNDATAAVSPSDNDTLFFAWADVTAADWRVLVTSASTLPSIAGVMIGEALTLTQNVNIGFAPPSLVPVVNSKTAKSESGAFIGGSKLNEGIEGEFNQSNIDPTWVRDSWIPFIDHVQTPKPFVFAWDYDSHSSEVVLAWSDKKQKTPTYSSGLYMDISLEFEGTK